MKKMIIAGNIGSDAVIREKSNSNEKFITFSVAINEDYTDKKTKEKVKRTDWISCILNFERYHKVVKYLNKGVFVTASGRPSINSYEGEEGFSVNFRLFINELTFFSPKTKVINAETGEIMDEPK